MGQGQRGGSRMGYLGGVMDSTTRAATLARYRVIAAFVLTGFYVAVKTVAHDYWSVGFGLALLGVILLTPQPEGAEPEPWRQHALRVVTACFVVVTIGSIWTSLAGT